MGNILNIAQELTDILRQEIIKEINREIIASMIDHMMPEREKYESFYHDHYNGLIKSDNLSDFQLYILHVTLYNAHLIYHTNDESQDEN